MLDFNGVWLLSIGTTPTLNLPRNQTCLLSFEGGCLIITTTSLETERVLVFEGGYLHFGVTRRFPDLLATSKTCLSMFTRERVLNPGVYG